jgi:phasin family protein
VTLGRDTRASHFSDISQEDFTMATNRNESGTEQTTRAAADAGREGLRIASETSQLLTDRAAQLFGFAGDRGQELSRQSSQNLEIVTEASAVLMRGFQDISQEVIGLVQERAQRNLEGLAALTRCRSLQDFLAAQSEFARTSLEQTVESTRRLAEVSTRVASEASRTLSTQADRSGRRRAA